MNEGAFVLLSFGSQSCLLPLEQDKALAGSSGAMVLLNMRMVLVTSVSLFDVTADIQLSAL